MLDSRSSTVERAYELAKSGQFRTVGEIKIRVRAEGYYDAVAQLEGRTITTALRRLIVAALAETKDPADPA
jgi:hypothetical protein